MMARLLTRRHLSSEAGADAGQSGNIKHCKKQPAFTSEHLKPFQHGFLRELVIRAANSASPDNGRMLADVYYHTSSGQKLRSRPDVAAYLAKNRGVPLTVDHFTFVRVAIYKPPHEVVRNATRPTALPVPATKKAPAEHSKRTGSPPCGLGQHHAGEDGSTGRRLSRKRQCCCCEVQNSSCKKLRSTGNAEVGRAFGLVDKTRLANKDLRTRHGLDRGVTRLPGKPFSYTIKYKSRSMQQAVPSYPKKVSRTQVATSNTKSLLRKAMDTQHGDSELASRPLLGKHLSSQKPSPSDRDKVNVEPPSQSDDGGMSESGAGNRSKETPAAFVTASSSRSCESKSLREFRISKHSQATPQNQGTLVGTCSSVGSKRPVVLVKDFLKDETSDTMLRVGKKTALELTTPVGPHVRSDYWQNTAAWDVYRLLKARENGPLENKSPDTPEVCLADLSKDPPILDEVTLVAEVSPTHHAQCLPAVDQGEQPAFAEANSAQREPSYVPCSLKCPSAQGRTPQLRCSRCLCLFHPMCVGMTSSHPSAIKGFFICKACTKIPRKLARMKSTKRLSDVERTSAVCNNASSKPEIIRVQAMKENAARTPPPSSSAFPSAVQTQCPSSSAASTVTCTLPSSLSGPPAGTTSLSSCTDNMPAATSSLNSTISVPVFHVVANSSQPSTNAATSRQVAQRPRLPLLLPAPPPPPATIGGSPREMPTLRIQSSGPQNLTVVPSVYYTIQVSQKPGGSMSGTELTSLVNQLVQKHPEELHKMGGGQTYMLQAPPVSVQASKKAQHLGSPNTFGEHLVSGLPVSANLQGTKLPLMPVQPLIATEAVIPEPVPSNLVQAALEDGAQMPAPQHSVTMKSLLHTQPKIVSVTSMAAGAQRRPAVSLQETACVATMMGPPPGQESLLGVVMPTQVPQAITRNAFSVPTVSSSISSSPKVGPVNVIAPKVQPPMPQLTIEEEAVTQTVPAAAQSTKLDALLVNSPGCEVSTIGDEGASQVITAKEEEGEAIYGLDTLPADPQPSCIITSSYSLADEPLLQSPSSVSEHIGGHKTTGNSANNSGKSSRDGISSVWSRGSKISKEQMEVMHKVADMWRSCNATETEVTSAVDGRVETLRYHSPNSSGHTVDDKAVAKPTANTEQQRLKEKVPVSSVSGVPCSPKAIKASRTKNKRHHRCDSSAVSVWVDSGGQLTCMRDKPRVLDTALQPVEAASNSSRNIQNLTEGFTILNHIMQWLPIPSLCKIAQVCNAWRMLTSMPHLWKRVDFRQLHVHNWDACVAKLKHMQTEELVLDKDSLDPVLSHASHLDAVQVVVVEVNPLQLVCLAGAFPHLRSLSAVITRKGLATKGGDPSQRHAASLGGLSELLCMTGLERLELRGAHGLALLPLTMPAHSLAQRCQHLRALSLLGVQSMSPAVVFLVSLLHGLEELHLGDCVSWTEMSFVNIGKLKQLRWLTLERGEDNDGFRTMLLRLEKLRRLDLRRWTLRNSLADTLCKMSELRHLLFWPLSTGSTLKTNRNILRSCLAARAKLEQITWIVSCRTLGTPLNVQQLALDVSLAFESGTLCECPQLAASSCYVTPAIDDIPKSLSSSPRARKGVPNLDSRESTSSPAKPCSSSHVSPSHLAHSRKSVIGVNSADSPGNASASLEQSQKLPVPSSHCCALAKTLLEVWKPSVHHTWHLTLRQLCQGLKHCLGPDRAVCLCVRFE